MKRIAIISLLLILAAVTVADVLLIAGGIIDPIPDVDTTAPTPNPPTWYTEPYSSQYDTIVMVATTAEDEDSPPVYYRFLETSGNPGGSNSNWQTSPAFTDTDLSQDTPYTYVIYTRDALENMSSPSEAKSATTGIIPDSDAPTPNPATWSVVPVATGPYSITMTATTGTDASVTVEYYFDETSGNPGGSDSGWTTNPVYPDTGLSPSTPYTYRVQMRDVYGNTGAWSSTLGDTTDAFSGNTYYLDAAVGSSGDGTTWATAKKTWAEMDNLLDALPANGAGDVVEINDGSYGLVWKGDTSSLVSEKTDWLILKAASGKTPVFAGFSLYPTVATNVYMRFEGLTIQPGSISLRLVNYNYIYNCTFIGDGFSTTGDDGGPRDGSKGIGLYMANNTTIDSCLITGDADGFTGTTLGGQDLSYFGKGYESGIEFQAYCSDVSIQDCNIESCLTGISGARRTNITITRNLIHHVTDGIVMDLCNTIESGLTGWNTVSYNQVYSLYPYNDKAPLSYHSDAFQVNDTECNFLHVIGNKMYLSDSDLIFCKGAVNGNGNTNWIFENNLCYDAIRRPTTGINAYNFRLSNCRDLIVRNNTVVGKGCFMVDLQRGGAGGETGKSILTQFTNNIMRSVDLWTDDNYTTVVIERNNIFDYHTSHSDTMAWDASTLLLGNNTTFEALFVDHASDDFNIPVGSTANDFGDGTYAPLTDLAGVTRGDPPCAGAYEYVP